MSSRINHVSVNALDLKESVDFYVDLLGAERAPDAELRAPGRAGSASAARSCTCSRRTCTPTSHHHLGITVDDLEPVYRVAERRDAFDRRAFGNHLVELPGDVIQLYVRDPAGNLVEIDHHGKDRLPDDLRSQVKGVWEFNEQSDANLRGRLYVPE